MVAHQHLAVLQFGDVSRLQTEVVRRHGALRAGRQDNALIRLRDECAPRYSSRSLLVHEEFRQRTERRQRDRVIGAVGGNGVRGVTHD
eukprot:29765-Eustigmatos_ZCMA.PRE.1